MLCASCFADDVVSACSGSYGVVSIPFQRVTSSRRRAQAHASAASYSFRRDWRAPRPAECVVCPGRNLLSTIVLCVRTM